MKEVKFKTNIKCMGCISTVAPHLEKVAGLESWSVDLNSTDKIMSTQVANEETVKAIEAALVEAGYSATEMAG